MADNITKSGVHECVEQLGMNFVPAGMKLHPCDLHGYFLATADNENPICPLCVQVPNEANGTTASDVSPVKDKNVDLTINL